GGRRRRRRGRRRAQRAGGRAARGCGLSGLPPLRPDPRGPRALRRRGPARARPRPLPARTRGELPIVVLLTYTPGVWIGVAAWWQEWLWHVAGCIAADWLAGGPHVSPGASLAALALGMADHPPFTHENTHPRSSKLDPPLALLDFPAGRAGRGPSGVALLWHHRRPAGPEAAGGPQLRPGSAAAGAGCPVRSLCRLLAEPGRPVAEPRREAGAAEEVLPPQGGAHRRGHPRDAPGAPAHGPRDERGGSRRTRGSRLADERRRATRPSSPAFTRALPA
ncbi:unnamed protein product, partial [Prorocentrum cordatum]